MYILLYRVAIVWGIVAGVPLHAHASSDLAAIIEAIRARSAAIESFAFEWTEIRQIPKGSMPRPEPSSTPQPPLDAVIPPEDVQLKSTSSLIVSGGRLRHSQSKELWCDNLNAMRREEKIDVFNGLDARRLFPVNVGDFPLALISPSSMRDNYRETATQPLFLVFRMLDERLGDPNLVEGKVDGAAIDESGEVCVLVESKPYPEITIVHWFSRQRGYIPTRRQTFFRDRVLGDLQIQYKSHDVAGWIPSGWRRISMDETGKLEHTIDATVTSAKINHRVSDGEFDLRFPRGTWVYDRDGMQDYVIRHDGTRRHVLPGESQKDYDQLVNSGRGWLGRAISMLAFVIIFAGAVLVAVWLVRPKNE